MNQELKIMYAYPKLELWDEGRLPLLFDIDQRLKVKNGKKYSLTKHGPFFNSSSNAGTSGCSTGCGGYYVGDFVDSHSSGFGGGHSSGGGDWGGADSGGHGGDSGCGGGGCGGCGGD